ncbi:hypothetical protein L1987_35391 [Smallanthus sonchifolius]|uniref:Uncharacterized protein n=1 Tax=Smallanthus sonchifolius TaxID=185202 RepID=A0ACB9HX97_9ASTR|nr:hypothetical protein L1987_35391 [Smallanthus sonchifolius]
MVCWSWCPWWLASGEGGVTGNEKGVIICMHFSNARLLPASAIVNTTSSTAKPHPSSITLQVSEKRTQIRPRVTPSSKGGYGELLTGNAQDKKIDRVSKEGSENIVESSSSHHVALLKGKHVKNTHTPSLPQNFEKDVVINTRNDDIVVMDYEPPRRETPIHNK